MRTLSCTLLTLILAAPLTATASSWSCSKGDMMREVMIERPADAYVPCEVVYKKPSEGVADQVLWNAQNDDAYCEEQATAFVNKLGGMGWNCAGSGTEAAVEAEAMESSADSATEAAAE